MTMEPEQTHQGESLPVACLLTFAAGLLDIYSYMIRGHVFANAITGNLVLLGMNLAAGEWLNCGRYLFAISAYGAGILVANIIHEKMPLPWGLSWKQFVLFLEILVLLPVAFIPSGDWNLLVNGMISFICAMQVRAFQHVHGLPFVSTTCTGNLRKGTNALFSGLFHHDLNEIRKAHHYYLVILSFVLGAVTGAFAFRDVLPYAVFIIPAVFLVVLWIISVEKKLKRT
ncbi:MAG: DUF1275 domain-containing protein [Lentisphaeria bacterium]|nr:DUF1275 domain-containing protein [Lentisphaeria bacterium]